MKKKTLVSWTSNTHTTHFEDCGCVTEKLERQIDALREALEFYADQENWKQKFVKREDGRIIMWVKAHIAKYKVAQEALQQSPRKGRK